MMRILAALLAAVLLQSCGGGSDDDSGCSGCSGPAQTRYFAFVANNINTGGTVSSFAINSASGALSAVTGSPL